MTAGSAPDSRRPARERFIVARAHGIGNPDPARNMECSWRELARIRSTGSRLVAVRGTQAISSRAYFARSVFCPDDVNRTTSFVSSASASMLSTGADAELRMADLHAQAQCETGADWSSSSHLHGMFFLAACVASAAPQAWFVEVVMCEVSWRPDEEERSVRRGPRTRPALRR